MKIVRINKGKVVSLPLRLLSVAGVVFLMVKLMNSLTEPLSIFVSIAIGALLPAIWFAAYVIVIDEEKKIIFDGIWTMGKRFGKTKQYEEIEKIFVNKVKTKQTMYSLANNQNIVTNHEFRVFIKLSNGEKFYLLSHPLEKRVNEKVIKIRQKLGIKQL